MPKTEYLSIEEITAKLYSADNPQSAILAVHGFLGSKESETIMALARRAAAHRCSVLAIDLPLHGDRRGQDIGAAKGNSAENMTAQTTEDIAAAVSFIKENISENVMIFAVSFGAFCALRYAEQTDFAGKMLLAVPAVNMAAPLIKLCEIMDSGFDIARAQEEGFCFKQAGIWLPFSFYEQMRALHAVRHSPAWNGGNIKALFAENDELISRADAEEFLRLNSAISAEIIQNSGHRISVDGKCLEQAMDFAEDFYFRMD